MNTFLWGFITTNILWIAGSIYYFFKMKPAKQELAKAIAVNKVNESINNVINKKLPKSRRERLAAFNDLDSPNK